MPSGTLHREQAQGLPHTWPCTPAPWDIPRGSREEHSYTRLSMGRQHRCGLRGIYETLNAEPRAHGHSYCLRGFKLKEMWPKHGLALGVQTSEAADRVTDNLYHFLLPPYHNLNQS